MTKKEREHPEMLNASRKVRVAKGSGTSVEEVNKLLKQYEQIKKMMKQFSDMGKSKQMRRAMGKMKFPF
jgi:signal recognition particle subunit SRP54